MEPLWKTHLAQDTAFDPQYHENPRDEIASFISDPPGVVLDVGCGGGATGTWSSSGPDSAVSPPSSERKSPTRACCSTLIGAIASSCLSEAVPPPPLASMARSSGGKAGDAEPWDGTLAASPAAG